jgi:hypothetical protein
MVTAIPRVERAVRRCPGPSTSVTCHMLSTGVPEGIAAEHQVANKVGHCAPKAAALSMLACSFEQPMQKRACALTGARSVFQPSTARHVLARGVLVGTNFLVAMVFDQVGL